MQRRWILALVLISFSSSVALAQQLSKKLTNSDVIELVSVGISDDIIIDKIRAADATGFDTSVAGLKALKGANVSDAVIRAMINPHGSSAPAAAPAAAPTAPAPEPEAAAEAPPAKYTGQLPTEVGVYVIRKGKLTEVEPEIVGWQTGGAVKHIATLGIDKGHVNGKVMNTRSPLQVPSPLEFLIRTPEGTSVTEYQLLRLYVKENRREFRAMTGGVVHSSGGAERNLVAFDSEKVANRVWRITLKNVGSGEYGFLPPGVNSASLSSSGKIYSFGVTE